MKKMTRKILHNFFCVISIACFLINCSVLSQPIGHWRTGATGNPPATPPDAVDATNNLLGTPAGVGLRFGTNGGIQRAIITAGGLFGVGTNNPQSFTHFHNPATGFFKSSFTQWTNPTTTGAGRGLFVGNVGLFALNNRTEAAEMSL